MRIYAVAAVLALNLGAVGAFAQPPDSLPVAPPSGQAPPSLVPPVGVGETLSSRTDTLSANFQDATVGDLIDVIANQGKLTVIVAPDAGPRSRRVLAKFAFTDLEAEEALRLLAQMSGLSVTAEGKGFRLDKNPQIKVPATLDSTNSSLWQGGQWKTVAKPFVLSLRLAGKNGGADEVRQELQVGERESFALTLRSAGTSYGVQGQAGRIVIDKEGRRQLPVRLHLASVIAGAKVNHTVNRDVRAPLDEGDESEVALQLGKESPFNPMLSVRDNTDYTAPK